MGATCIGYFISHVYASIFLLDISKMGFLLEYCSMSCMKKFSSITKAACNIFYCGCLFASADGLLSRQIGTLQIAQRVTRLNYDVLHQKNQQECIATFSKVGAASQVDAVIAGDVSHVEDENVEHNGIVEPIKNDDEQIAEITKDDARHMSGVIHGLSIVSGTALGIVLHILYSDSVYHKRADKVFWHLIGRPYWCVLYNLVYSANVLSTISSTIAVFANAFLAFDEGNSGKSLNVQGVASVLRQWLTYMCSLYDSVSVRYHTNQEVHQICQSLFGIAQIGGSATALSGSQGNCLCNLKCFCRSRCFYRSRAGRHVSTVPSRGGGKDVHHFVGCVRRRACRRDNVSSYSAEATLPSFDENAMMLLKNIITVDILLFSNNEAQEDDGFRRSCFNNDKLLSFFGYIMTPIVMIASSAIIILDTIINLNFPPNEANNDTNNGANVGDNTTVANRALFKKVVLFKACEMLVNVLCLMKNFALRKHYSNTAIKSINVLIDDFCEHIFFTHTYCRIKKGDDVIIPDILLQKHKVLCNQDGKNTFFSKEQESNPKEVIHKFSQRYAYNMITLFKYLRADDMLRLESVIEECCKYRSHIQFIHELQRDVLMKDRINYIYTYIRAGYVASFCNDSGGEACAAVNTVEVSVQRAHADAVRLGASSV